MMIDDVIAMHAPGPRAQVRRCIAMINAQRCEVWDQVGGLREGEVTIELQTIGGDGNGRCFPHFKNHAVVNGCMSRLPSFEPGVPAVVYSRSPSGALGTWTLSPLKLAISVNAPPDAKGQRTRTPLLPSSSNFDLPGSSSLMRGTISFRRSARSSREKPSQSLCGADCKQAQLSFELKN